ncbi:MAG: SWIM zinc finger family protein [Planctomycetaceae bacterium]|nr:SWIM zinc finger family protein [Planctomycetaceae bacterium]
MSAALKLEYTYRYPFPSRLERDGARSRLQLATFRGGADEAESNPFFFEGRMRTPRLTAELMLALNQVVTSRFYLPQLALHIDPVVTSSEEVLRLEGFSSCCGVYARVDLPAAAFDGALQGRGTTNVDFNSAMRAALAQVRDGDDVQLSIGAKEFRLTREAGSVVERKVSLPVRWIKGFAEVQAYQASLQLRFEISAAEARRFVRSLPRGAAPKLPSFVTPLGAGLRLSQREAAGSVRVTGTDRLRLLEPLLHQAEQLRVWANDSSGTSAWEVVFEQGRFLLLISPEVWRGFSGEGQLLDRLAANDWEAALPLVQSNLKWQSRIDVSQMAEQLALAPREIDAALAILGSRGLVGFDIATGQYFHRELPFDMDKVESLQPRLKDARQLLAEGKARITQQSKAAAGETTAEVLVQGTDVEHRVRLLPDGDKCSCPWYSKHQLDRGPCKHILAARLLIDDDEIERNSE